MKRLAPPTDCGRAHRALCVYATEERLFTLNAGGPSTFHRSLPAPASVTDGWVQFIDRCQAAGIDPVSYIRRVFAIRPPDMAAPNMQQIVRGNVKTRYRSLDKQIMAELKATRVSQTQIIDRYMALGTRHGAPDAAVVQTVAADPFIPLHPVVRLNLAARSKLPVDWKPTVPLVAEAVLTYGRTPDLFDRAWGGRWIYPKLRERGALDYERLLRLKV